MSFSCLYMLKRAKIDFCKNEKFFNFLQMIDFQRFKTALARGRSILKQKLNSLSITKFFFAKVLEFENSVLL